MPLKPELLAFVGRATMILDDVRVRVGAESEKLRAMTQLSDFGTDDMVKAIVGDARTAVRDALVALDATDFYTADLATIGVIVETPPP